MVTVATFGENGDTAAQTTDGRRTKPMIPVRRVLVGLVPLAAGWALILATGALAADPSPAPTGSGTNVPGDGTPDWSFYPFVLIGIVISILIPAFRKARGTGGVRGLPAWLTAIWNAIMPYRYAAALSLAVSIFIMFVAEKEIGTQVAAFVAGYSWDSTLQKFTGKP